MELEKLTGQRLLELIEAKDVKEIRRIFEVVPTIDIAEACNEIEDVSKLVFIFKTVKSEYTADLFTELDTDVKYELIRVMSDAELAKVIDGQFDDDLADDIEEMPANLVIRVLRTVDKERRATINKLLNYKENTAGSIMTTEFFSILDNLTADEAIAKIRQYGKDKETVFTVFVMDPRRNLVGTVDLDDLIFAKGDAKITSIMNRDFVTVNVNTDQEEVANIVKRYDLNVIAVTNNDNRLVGIITIDDIVDVIEQEATEDVSALSHVTPLEDSYLDTSVWQMAKKCIPWIIVLLVLGTFTTLVLDKIEKQAVFALIPALICFVPTLMDTGGNSGGQTIALMIRGLATKEFTPKDYFKILGKEASSAVIIAFFVALFSFIWFMIEQATGIVTNVETADQVAKTIWNGQFFETENLVTSLKIAGTVSITLFVSAFMSKIVAVTLPLTVAALKKDPAIVAQPLLTTIIDVISLLTYWGIASIAFTLL